MRLIFTFLISVFLTSCSNMRFCINLTVTGEYEEQIEKYEDNVNYREKWALKYYPLEKRIDITENKTIYLK